MTWAHIAPQQFLFSAGSGCCPMTLPQHHPKVATASFRMKCPRNHKFSRKMAEEAASNIFCGSSDEDDVINMKNSSPRHVDKFILLVIFLWLSFWNRSVSFAKMFQQRQYIALFLCPVYLHSAAVVWVKTVVFTGQSLLSIGDIRVYCTFSQARTFSYRDYLIPAISNVSPH